jgi:hypothetical protein
MAPAAAQRNVDSRLNQLERALDLGSFATCRTLCGMRLRHGTFARQDNGISASRVMAHDTSMEFALLVIAPGGLARRTLRCDPVMCFATPV